MTLDTVKPLSLGPALWQSFAPQIHLSTHGLGKVQEDMPNVWDPATHMEDPAVAPSFSLAILGVNQ